jgi:excisionase family DNA binding protein
MMRRPQLTGADDKPPRIMDGAVAQTASYQCMKNDEQRQTAHYLALPINRTLETSGLGRSKVYELLASGELTKIKVGRRTLIDYQSLASFLERHRVQGKQD